MKPLRLCAAGWVAFGALAGAAEAQQPRCDTREKANLSGCSAALRMLFNSSIRGGRPRLDHAPNLALWPSPVRFNQARDICIILGVMLLGTSKNIPLWCDDRGSSSQRDRSFNPWPLIEAA
jgi:hypothetical protein